MATSLVLLLHAVDTAATQLVAHVTCETQRNASSVLAHGRAVLSRVHAFIEHPASVIGGVRARNNRLTTGNANTAFHYMRRVIAMTQYAVSSVLCPTEHCLAGVMAQRNALAASAPMMHVYATHAEACWSTLRGTRHEAYWTIAALHDILAGMAHSFEVERSATSYVPRSIQALVRQSEAHYVPMNAPAMTHEAWHNELVRIGQSTYGTDSGRMFHELDFYTRSVCHLLVVTCQLHPNIAALPIMNQAHVALERLGHTIACMLDHRETLSMTLEYALRADTLNMIPLAAMHVNQAWSAMCMQVRHEHAALHEVIVNVVYATGRLRAVLSAFMSQLVLAGGGDAMIMAHADDPTEEDEDDLSVLARAAESVVATTAT